MNMTRRNWVKTAISSALLCVAAAGPSAFAQTTQTAHSPDEIKAQYKTDMERCDALKGNDKDVCKKQAKADRDSANADAKSGKERAEAEHDAVKEKRDAQYGVEKEKCDAMSGDAKDQCIAQARTKYGK